MTWFMCMVTRSVYGLCLPLETRDRNDYYYYFCFNRISHSDISSEQKRRIYPEIWCVNNERPRYSQQNGRMMIILFHAIHRARNKRNLLFSFWKLIESTADSNRDSTRWPSRIYMNNCDKSARALVTAVKIREQYLKRSAVVINAANRQNVCWGKN